MKRLIPYLVITSMCLTNAVWGQEPAKAQADEIPDFKIKGAYNHVDRAKFYHPRSEKQHHLTFSEGWAVGTYKYKLSEERKVFLGAGYMGTKFRFSHHPRKTSFEERHFDNFLVHGGASTYEIAGWKWKGDLGLQMNTEHFSISRYTLFTGLLHGRYDYNKKSHLHAGIVGCSGLRYTRVLPIVGGDYTFNEKWKLNAVFPLNMSIVYTMTPQWRLDGAIRYFLTRQRLGDEGHFKRGFVAYRNWGAEVGLNYALNQHVRFNAHVGESFAGRMRISHRHDNHRHHLRLDGALYYGFDAQIAF